MSLQIQITYEDENNEDSPVTKDFITNMLPKILTSESILEAFRPLFANKSSQTTEILNMFLQTLSVKVMSDSPLKRYTHQDHPPSSTLWLYPAFVSDLEQKPSQLHRQQYNSQIRECKFLVLGCILHQLGHYVYEELRKQGKNATKIHVGNEELNIVHRMTSLVEETPTEITKPYQQAENEQDERTQQTQRPDYTFQPQRVNPTRLDPGQVVELGVFGFVADFWTTRDPSRADIVYLFHHVAEFYGPDQTPIPSKKVFDEMMSSAPEIKQAQRDHLQYCGDLEIPFRESAYRRVGFGTLNATHPNSFYWDERVKGEEDLLRPPHPPGWRK
jgi:hypothetical protein